MEFSVFISDCASLNTGNVQSGMNADDFRMGTSGRKGSPLHAFWAVCVKMVFQGTWQKAEDR